MVIYYKSKQFLSQKKLFKYIRKEYQWLNVIILKNSWKKDIKLNLGFNIGTMNNEVINIEFLVTESQKMVIYIKEYEGKTFDICNVDREEIAEHISNFFNNVQP